MGHRAQGGEERGPRAPTDGTELPSDRSALAVGPPPAASGTERTIVGGMTAESMQALLGQNALRAPTQVAPPPRGEGQNALPGGGLPAIPIKVSLPAATVAVPQSHLPPVNRHAGAAYAPSPAVMPPPAPPAAGLRVFGVVLGTIGAFGLVVTVAAFVYGAPPWLQARSFAEPRPAAAAVAPQATQTRVAGASSATDALITACLRDSTQTIKSANRDQLLLEAVKAYDVGHRERAHTLLKEYTHEACDRATLELLTALDRQISHRIQE